MVGSDGWNTAPAEAAVTKEDMIIDFIVATLKNEEL